MQAADKNSFRDLIGATGDYIDGSEFNGNAYRYDFFYDDSSKDDDAESFNNAEINKN